MSDLFRQSLWIGRTRIRRRYRRIASSPLLLVFNVLPLLLITVGVVGQLPISGYEAVWSEMGAFEYGRRFATEKGSDIVGTMRGFASLLFLSVTYFVLYRRIAADNALDSDSKVLLTAVEPKVLVVAEMITLMAFSGRSIGVILLFGTVAFGVGAGTPLATVLLLVAGLSLISTAVALTYPAVLGARFLFQHFEAVQNAKNVVAGLAFLGMVGLLLSLRQSFEMLSILPLGWYVDFAIVWTTGAGDPLRGLAAIGFTPVSIVVGVALGGRFGAALWFTDADTATVNQPGSLDRFGGSLPLERLLPNQLLTTVRANWARLLREPRVFLISGLLLVVTMMATHTVARQRPEILPLFVIVYGATTVGAGPTLNPLGNQGPALGAMLSSPDGGRLLLVGSALAVGLPGSVFVGAAAFVAAMATSHPVGLQVAVTVLGGALGLLVPFISLGIGMSFPKLDGFDPIGDRSTQTPHLEAVLLLLFLMLAIGTPAIVGLSGAPIPGVGPLDTSTSSFLGVVLTLSAGILAAVLSYCRASRLIRNYEIGG